MLANLRLVVKIAMEYRRAWTNVLDLIQDGNVGLLQAVQRFDPYQGVKLSSYAVYWIRAYILKYIIDNIRLVRIGKTRAERKLFFRLNKEKRELERQGFEAEPKLLAERLEVSESDVRRHGAAALARATSRCNAPAHRDDDGARDRRPAAAAGRERRAERRRRRAASGLPGAGARVRGLARARATAGSWRSASSPRSRARCRSWATSSASRASAIRQLEARLVSRLREYLKENLVDFEYYAAPKE